MNSQTFSAELVEFLSTRKSIGAKFLQEPAPTLNQLKEAVKAALAVPDHCHLYPCRAVLINNREKLAELFYEGAVQAGASDEDAARAKDKALKAPAMVAFIVAIEKENPRVPPYEQWMTAGSFASTFLNVLESMGYAGKIVSGANTTYAPVVKALCSPEEQIAAWLMVGTPKAMDREEVPRPDPSSYMTEWS